MATVNDLKENNENNLNEVETLSELKRLNLIPESRLNKETMETVLGHIENENLLGVDEIGKIAELEYEMVENTDSEALPKNDDLHNKKTEIALEVAKVANTTFKYLGKSLTFAVIAIDACRIGSSIHDDIKIREHAPAILKEIDEILECLHKKKVETKANDELKEISELIAYYTRLKKEVKLIEKQVPCRTIKTGASIGGSWFSGAAGATGGGWAGFHAGAALGTFFGPAGTAMGGIIGGIIGSVSVGIASGIAGSHVGGTVAEWGLEKTHDVLYRD